MAEAAKGEEMNHSTLHEIAKCLCCFLIGAILMGLALIALGL